MLALLNLAQNDLIGPLPALLGNLSDLQVLKLQFNNLSGDIPSKITRLQLLSTLNMSWNSLTGSIPSSISSLQIKEKRGKFEITLRFLLIWAAMVRREIGDFKNEERFSVLDALHYGLTSEFAILHL
ncbi:hypothetical protein DKX38_013771 [Salix brachista]|uniref:Uncharacterized protein n=1 Tax=Salix brachista TaxID=2182728 RepID=A0A5N5LDN3_9ROSI|nr:hypothetical protein DKX38_013771 [Salix brachista]